jgi:hypothetical protein
MSSGKISTMISILGDKDGSVTRKLQALLMEGVLPDGVVLLNVDEKQSFRKAAASSISSNICIPSQVASK